MIELLFDDDIKVPLQIHSRKTYLYLYEQHSLNFVWNHLVTDHILVDICRGVDENCSLSLPIVSLYHFHLSKYPKNIEEMKIARYLFQLLFNCSFHLFKIHIVVINPKMIELLFDDDIKVPLQIHSRKTYLYLYEQHSLNFVWNHLVTDHILVDICRGVDENCSLSLPIVCSSYK
uniref:Uncharacterized protein n=1 Tax=Meloidogyne enterolobii TaxID=390850 RepID=A0A6V7V9T5_MELEN|nr:unnamed protein product [Meloidogyne enterolobii]